MFKSDALEGLLEGDTNTEALALREEIEGLNRVCMATVCCTCCPPGMMAPDMRRLLDLALLCTRLMLLWVYVCRS